MTHPLRSLYGKISVIFLTLLIPLLFVQIWVSVHSSGRFVQESEQKLNRDLAVNIAEEFKPFLQDSLHHKEIKNLIHYLMVMNPRVELYLVDSTGRILAYFTGPEKRLQRDRIDLRPVRAFLHESAAFPILGDDPRHADRRKPFSVAPIAIPPNAQGYLYIILGSELYDSAIEMIRESYILRIASSGLLTTIVVTALLGLIVFAMLARRFRTLHDTVKQFEQGDYRARIPVDSRDEIGQLARAFNQMADRIVQNMQELKRTDDLRRELVANVSHDLRSPLASIQGYLETIMMKEDSLSPEDRRRYLNIILDNATLLNQLIGELFELSKLDACQIQPKTELFSMAELTQDVVIKFQPQAEKLGVTLETQFPEALPQVYADIALIERALSNLIDNAIRYAPEGGRVEVRLQEKDRKVWVFVSDNGPGIPAEDLPRIFERFYRIDKSRTRSYSGAGLGLAIAKKILEIHRSSIQVESQLHCGTTFSFALPRASLAEKQS